MLEVMGKTITEKAIELYDVYTAAVGGKAYDGRPLPSGEEFMSDPAKQKQADAWRAVALYALGGDTEGMNFSTALWVLQQGFAVRLPHWKEDVRIKLQVPDEGSKMTHAYLYVESRFGCVPWIPTQVELLSTEWQFATEKEEVAHV